jgi:ATP-dependent helicase HrpB
VDLRVNRLAEWFPELEVNPITDADRATLIEQICYGELGARDMKDKPVMPVLRDWLTAEQLAVLDDYLPERLVMANGRKARLTYAKEGPPVLSARIQELYGVEGKFTLGARPRAGEDRGAGAEPAADPGDRRPQRTSGASSIRR